MIKRSAFKSTWKDRCDELYSNIITSSGHCRRCGASDLLTCAHYVPRRYSATRCDIRNACCLCLRCHRRLTDNPTEHDAFVVSVIGEELYEELKRQAQTPTKVDWQQKHRELKKLCTKQ